MEERNKTAKNIIQRNVEKTKSWFERMSRCNKKKWRRIWDELDETKGKVLIKLQRKRGKVKRKRKKECKKLKMLEGIKTRIEK